MAKNWMNLDEHLQNADDLAVASYYLSRVFHRCQARFRASHPVMKLLFKVLPSNLGGLWPKLKSELDKEYCRVTTGEERKRYGFIYYGSHRRFGEIQKGVDRAVPGPSDTDADVGVLSAEELQSLSFSPEDRHPDVEIDYAALVLKVYNGEYWYEVDLEELTSAASIVSWLLHLSEKRWAAHGILYQVLSAVDTAVKKIFQRGGAREVFCHELTRQGSTIDWKKARLGRIG